MKTCTTCKLVKGEWEFHRDSHRPDGLQNKCKDCRLGKAKAYRSHNRARRAAYLRVWREANPEHNKAYQKRWRQRTGKQVAYNSNYRSLKVEALGNFTAEDFEWLCIDHNHQCLDCGSYDKMLSADHVIPLSEGGDNTIDNIQPLCGPCNSRKGVKTIDYRIAVSR